MFGLSLFVGTAAQAALDAEAVRRFFDDGPGLLLPASERTRLAAASPEERATAAEAFLSRDPFPETPENELARAIEQRTRRVAAAGLSPFDDRARLLFLQGEPTERIEIECAAVFRPLEIWRYGEVPTARYAVFLRTGVGQFFRLWKPTQAKRVLYTDEMEYLLTQLEELRGQVRVRGKRPDYAMCDHAEQIDAITGVDGLYGFERGRMRDADVERWLAPPADLAAWVRGVLETNDPIGADDLPPATLRLSFPERRDQRLVARMRIELAPDSALGVADSGGGAIHRVSVVGFVERPEGRFEEFRNRFLFAVPPTGNPDVLVVERALRPKETFVLRLEVRDEVTNRVTYLSRGFEVPAEPVPEPAIASDREQVGEELGLAKLEGRDSIVLLPPPEDVVFGLYRAEAIVVGDRIRRVVFSLDGKPQLTRGAPPWTAELRLPTLPQEAIVRVEALDGDGQVIAADEILLNEPQGEARVRLLEPARGRKVVGAARARAAVVAPEGRRVRQVEFKMNDERIAVLERPPWETRIDVPDDGQLYYLTVIATYDDGATVEDFRVLNSTDFLAEVQVDLVEVYATVTDRDGNLVDGLTAADFTLKDNKRPQTISKFELVRQLPLTLGLALDTSGSMSESLVEAKRAASGFLANVMTLRDRCFAVAFANRPALLMPLTSDARAVDAALSAQPALGATSLHDALVYALYQYRGVRGRKALVLLSDGDDNSSLVPWKDALAYAQRSGVSIYTIGLGIGAGSLGIRDKLRDLAVETGGRTFFVDSADELAGVYEQIEKELRSQYLLAFSPDPVPRAGERHELQVTVRDRSQKVRAARGYTP